MLGKLIKYDFKSLSRILFPTLFAIMVAALLAGGLLSLSDFDDVMNIPLILKVISGVITAILMFSIFAACFVILFIILQRFYRSTVTSEGYLTFTLPVTSANILLSKLIVSVLWSIITIVSLFIAFNLFILIAPIPNTSEGSAFIDMWKFIGESFREYFTGVTALLIFEIIVISIVVLANSFLQFFLAIIIGGIVSQKHKVLAGIGFYFIINTVQGIISSIVFQVTFYSKYINNSNSLELEMREARLESLPKTQMLSELVSEAQPYLLMIFGIAAVFAVACFLLSNYLMKNKLNLQ